MRTLLLLLASTVACFGQAFTLRDPILSHQMAYGAGPALLFYSDFEDETDDGQWTIVGGTPDLDSTTSPAPLFDTESAALSQLSDYIKTTIPLNTVDNVYFRMAIRCSNTNTTTTTTSVRVQLGYNGTRTARLDFIGHTDDYNHRIEVIDRANNNGADTISPRVFDDQTYWLYLTYTRSTSISGSVLDATQASIGLGRTLTITEDYPINELTIEVLRQNWVIDSVEVRTDTNWGTGLP